MGVKQEVGAQSNDTMNDEDWSENDVEGRHLGLISFISIDVPANMHYVSQYICTNILSAYIFLFIGLFTLWTIRQPRYETTNTGLINISRA